MSRAQDDAPNYRESENTDEICRTCVHAVDGRCDLYDFGFTPTWVCDSWEMREERTVEDNPIRTLFEKVKGLFTDVMEQRENRALSINDVAMRAESELPPFAWIHDIFFNEAGSPFIIYSDEGKLFRVAVTVSGDDVTIGESEEVVQEFRPTTSTRVIRQSDGSHRWFSISATAVLNRVGEIDSRELFDSFIEHATTTGEYPYRTFFHQGEMFRTGQADYLARDGYAYITSGVYDDNDLAKAEIEARERDPQYYGESIGFRATEQPDIMNIEGVDIPVYTRGVNVEISTLPEHKAASWYTNTIQEVSRMREEVRDELLRLFGGDETRANAFVESVDATNREIEDDELLTRAQEHVDGEDSETDSEQETDAETDTEQETDTDTDDEELDESESDEEEIPTIEISSEILDEVKEHVEQSLSSQLDTVTATLEEVSRQLEQLSNDVVELDRRGSQRETQADERFRALESDEEDKLRELMDDMPARSKVKVTYRPRHQERYKQSDDEMSLAQRADQVEWPS